MGNDAGVRLADAPLCASRSWPRIRQIKSGDDHEKLMARVVLGRFLHALLRPRAGARYAFRHRPGRVAHIRGARVRTGRALREALRPRPWTWPRATARCSTTS